MAIELITGRAGKAHIGSEDDRAYHAYTNGEGRYILNGGTANIESANNVHIDPVEFLVDGAHVRVTGAGEDVAIENGVASYKRIDVIALHYTRTGNEDNYIESVEFAVVKGANAELGGTPHVPSMPKSGTILTGSNDVYVPVYSLLIDGLTPKNLTTLLEKYALPVAHGGTGATTAKNAMANLGAMSSSDMEIEMRYKVLNGGRVSAGDLTFTFDAFLEFGHIPNTKINFVNRMELQGIVTGPEGHIIAKDTTILPSGSIPKRYLPADFTEDRIGLVCHMFRDTTTQDISIQYSMPITLSIHPDGSVSINEAITKFYAANMAARIYCDAQFLALNAKLES